MKIRLMTLAATALAFFPTLSFAHLTDHNEPFSLHCTLTANDQVTVTGVGSRLISLRYYDDGVYTFNVGRSMKSDCSDRRGYDCYLSGQFMVNIPKELVTGKEKQGTVFINGDVDDRTDNGNLGDEYVCSR